MGVALAVTALLAVLADPLTARHLTLDARGAGKGFDRYWYADESSGGNSTVLPDDHKPLAWSCSLGPAYEFRYCGFGILFDRQHQGRGLDLSRYENLKLRIRYSGPGDLLRLTIKNHDPRYSRPDRPNSDKVLQAAILVRNGTQTLNVKLSDFAVAEWWREQMKLTPDLAAPEFGNVVALELVTGSDSRAGLHRIALDEIQLEGRYLSLRQWYAIIGIGWLLLLGGLLVRDRQRRARVRDHIAMGLGRTLETIPQMVWYSDADGHFFFNSRWHEFTGVDLAAVPNSHFVGLIHPDDRSQVIEAWTSAAETRLPFDCEYRLMHQTDGFRWVLARAVPAMSESGLPEWFGTCTDIHDRVTAQQALALSVSSERQRSVELKWASEHDALTRLPNRHAFEMRLQACCLGAMSIGGTIGLLLVDLDHFKHVNDTMGHSAGDDLLQAVARTLRASVRAGDFVSRVGGDEFAIIIGDARDAADLQRIGNAVLARLRKPKQVAGRGTAVAASIGGALFPSHGATANDLFKAADTALYALKEAGRGGISIFDPAMLERVSLAASQLSLARKVITEKNVVPFYQPKVDIATGLVVGFEALLRWKDTDNGLQLPATVEEAFRDYELAARIGRLMQAKVARDVRGWLEAGVPIGSVAINAAPSEFLRDDYADGLLQVLQRYRVPAEYIEVEVTEHVFMERGSEFVARALTQLKRAGVTIALDDFGTGHSSLSHLRDFPVDSVKIDKSFIRQMSDDGEIAAIVSAVITLAHSLGIDAVAEGVEAPAQLEWLRRRGCQFAQGFLFGHAVAAASVPDLVAAQKVAA